MPKRPAAESETSSSQALPLIVEEDEDGIFVVECPVLPGCYTQGETLDEALKNIEEVFDLLLEEEENREILRGYRPQNVSLHFHTVTL